MILIRMTKGKLGYLISVNQERNNQKTISISYD